MSVLTRIKNNQITDSTIYANAKIVPGSIVGSLFNSNITVTSDFLITGNLTVLGNSTVSTVASTNTFVNDPLIVLNNAYSGTNTYDLGLIFNRGSDTNQALFWDESADELVFVATSETGTTYGNVAISSYGNLRLGNLTVQYDVSARNITTSADIAVNGGDLTTTATTFNLLNTDATTINLGGAATTLALGATTGTLTLKNPTIVGNDTTQNLFNSTTTTLNFAGAATSVVMGATTGTTTIRNQVLSLPNASNIASGQTTVSLLDNAVTTLNFAGAATAIDIGASTGKTTFVSADEASGLSEGAVVVTGGASIGANLWVGKDLHVLGNITVVGNTTIVETNNVSFTDSIIELHTLPGSANLTVDDGRDIGIRYHFYKTSNDNAFLGWSNDTGYLEWYGSGVTETGNVTINGEYGTFKSGNVILNQNATVGNLLSIVNGGRIQLGGGLLGNAIYPESMIQTTRDSNLISRISTQNLSSGIGASSEFQAMADNGSNVTYYMATGITSSNFAQDRAFKENDAFFYTITDPSQPGGNIAIAATRDVVIASGGFGDSNVYARFNRDTSNVSIIKTTAATSYNTGAFTVTGGVGLGSNLYVKNGAVFNDNQSTEAVTVRGVNSTAMFVIEPNYQAVLVNGPSGGSNVTINSGVSFEVRSNDAMVVPVGTSAQRPGSSGNVDVAGMVRYNSTISALEYYTGTTWNTAGSVFTVISSRQFTTSSGNPYGNVDGTNATFTVQSSTTTSAAMITINGVVQLPTVAYNISGTTLTFTEAPAVGDLVDVRIFTTTATVTQLASASGYNQLFADNDGVSAWTGTVATIQRLLVDPVGNFNFTGTKNTYNQVATNIASSATPVLIDTFSNTTYSTAKYLVQIKNSSNKVEAMEALVTAEGSNASVTTYGIISSHGGSIGTLSANVVSGNCRLYFTSSSLSNSNVKVMATYILA